MTIAMTAIDARRALRIATASIVAIVVLVTSTACDSQRAPRVSAEPLRIATADYAGDGPGSLVEAKTIPNIDRVIPLGTTSARVVYRSTSGVDGSATQVSGAVFVPPGRPPKGGWPVIAFAHGTTGINQECAPSLSPNIWGAAELIASFLRSGLAVAAPDYQGLGTPGEHPYLDAKTAGLNVIDAVRALRKVSKDVSARWVAYGGSQGGAATWAANEQESTYATELDLLGTVSLVPPADLSGYAPAAAAQRLTEDQTAAYINILITLQRTRPGFPIDDFRRGLVQEKWDVFSACIGPTAEERATLLKSVPPTDLVPSTPEAERLMFDVLKSMALPQQRASAPMLIIYAGQDTFIDPEWTRQAIARACQLGDTIWSVFQPDKGHGDINDDQYIEWLAQRLGGLPAPNNC